MQKIYNHIEKHFERFPEKAKTYVFQAGKTIHPERIKIINQKLSGFLKNWRAHGIPLNPEYLWIENAVLVIIADETNQQVTGCSQDELMKFLKAIATEFHLEFFNRFIVTIIDNNRLQFTNLHELNELNQKGMINENTLLINPMVKNKEELLTMLICPLKESWQKQFLKSSV
jgi:hypothetical protein